MSSSKLTLSHTALPRFLARILPGALLLGAWVPNASGQDVPPPPPLPPSEEESAALDDTSPENIDAEPEEGTPPEAPTPLAPDSAANQNPAATPAPPVPPPSALGAEASASTDLGMAAALDSESEEPPPSDESWFRQVSTRRQSSLSGSTGLFRVKEAGSGAPGTFRMQLMAGYFSGKEFLCNSAYPCFDPVTGEPSLSDKSQRSTGLINLSVTPFSFLEAFMTITNSATYNSEGAPQSLQVVGDTNFGVKGFLPQVPDRIIKAGAEADVYLMTGTGGVGLSGGATSFALRALATLDLNNRSEESDRIPLRAHVNLGYFFDNSANLVKDLENTDPPEGRGQPISRTERYGLGISRVDSFQIGMGAEYINPYVRPFLEWNLDVPVNRAGYECVITDRVNDRTVNADECLKLGAGLASSPSRLTLGTRIFPWQASGLALSLGADIGTGASRRFLDETRPEAPYTLWFGLGYTVDVVEKEPEAVVDPNLLAPTAPVAETRRYVSGRIVDDQSGEGVPDAIVRYKDVPMTGLVTNADGLFITQDLPPGEYVFSVKAKDYKDGICVVDIPETVATAPEATSPEPSVMDPLPGETAVDTDTTAVATADPTSPYLDADGNVLVPLDCKLGELPPVANITGLLVDGRNGGPVTDAQVTIIDKLNRSLSLDVDAAGAFQFRNVPFGDAHIRATAPGYLPTIHPVKVASRDELKPHILMNARPEKLGVTFTKTEVKLARKIEFVGDTVDLMLNSTAMIEELAVALAENSEAGNVEIQVHTDDSGAASFARRLSQERADRIKQLLVDLGVLERRVTAKGYGPDQPLTPNVSDESRAKNNRVQFVITQE